MTAYAVDGNVYQEFVLLYAKQEGKDPGWYQFDQKEGTLQRLNEAQLSSNEEKTDIDIAPEIQKYQDRIDILGLVMGVGACIIILLLILVIRVYMRQKGYNDELE